MVMMTEGLSRLTPERRRRRRRPLFRRHQRLLARPAMFVLPFDKHKKTQAACVTYCLPPSVPRCLPESDTMALVRVSEPHARFACGETVRPPPNGIWPLEARRRTEEAHRATMLQRRLRPSWLGDRERGGGNLRDVTPSFRSLLPPRGMRLSSRPPSERASRYSEFEHFKELRRVENPRPAQRSLLGGIHTSQSALQQPIYTPLTHAPVCPVPRASFPMSQYNSRRLD